ncbi:WD40 repeat-like protein [Anaeromyces robustus]|uniref:Glutamate-rich WD repeat-containing protein 1 n=1 Tax=Anaeromyces robustus TaxID=1754192 RepID=A0A1Y1X976_9FUNG|nr:WD40 repeat-like protein [Anaeromyces robustus]|eukprot:ORX81894.1 WD40 repeat-like protein [Anaeromyces robustus]
MGEFEDPFGDENDSEEEIIETNEEGMDIDDEEEEEEPKHETYLPGKEMGENEVLVVDNSAYEMLYTMNVEWPCLSFDFLNDNLGVNRVSFPMTAYLVSGSQAEEQKNNKLYVLKMSQMNRTKYDDDFEDDNSDDGLDDDPILESRSIPHQGGINRVRVMPHPESHIVATWAETGQVNIFDVTTAVKSFDVPGVTVNTKTIKPIYTVKSHGRAEGFALDWSKAETGRLLSGDINKHIYLTNPTESSFKTDIQPFTGHQSSVEDIQWSPKEKCVFASCSADQTIKIWDTRAGKRHQLSVRAHESDVNVIHWNQITDFLMASGADDGVFKIWDLRQNFGSNNTTAVASFKWHTAPITSIEFHPQDSSMLAVSGADEQLTLWDLSVERDVEEEKNIGSDVQDLPPQLMFIHQGQNDIKELHWHKQLPGVIGSTASNGMNIFKTINSQ